MKVTVTDSYGTPKMIYHDGEISVSEKTVASAAEACADFVRPFDLENGPLYRFTLVHTESELLFLFDVHHIVFDGTSLSAFVSQIASAYDGGECPAEALTLFDVSLAEQGIKDGKPYSLAREFFREKLDGVDFNSAPVPDVITGETYEGTGTVNVHADFLTSEQVLHFTKKNKITENTLFLGAFAYALAKFNGATESAFCTVNNGRHDPRLAGSVGMFVKTLPLFFSFDEAGRVTDFLSQTQKTFFDTMSHDVISFGELAEKYGANTNVTFVYQAEMLTDAKMKNGSIRVETLDVGDAPSDINVMLFKTNDGYEASVHFRKSLYTEELIRGLIGMFINTVRNMLSAETLDAIVFTDSESRAVIERFNDTQKPYDTEKTVVELFCDQAKKTPDAECLVYEDKRFTYREVDDITDRLASHLHALGIGKGTVTGVLIPRCEYMLLCSLGVLKAGGAYLPLDPTYPPERLNLMMRDSDAALLITTPELDGIITSDFAGVRMMTRDIMSLPKADKRLPYPDKDDLFVMLYTSGSTGTPKGVMFKHSNTMVTAAWERDFFRLGEGDRATAYASYGFDANVFDTYATITSGAALYIISDEIRLDLLALQKYYNENKITHTVMTTQVGRQFTLLPGTTSLKCLSVAGEKLTPLDFKGDFKLYNLYGPTEGSVLCTGFCVDRYYKDIPIGKAIDNVKLYVTDSKGRLLPVGAAGELWISGAHVTAGYRNRPEKTAEAYGMNPFCSEPGYERVYHTGDIVRCLGDGNLQFIG
ncbi:MAG: AMP-binding protein, partial [Clostridiales bacterium]|nr:AMP-binding protein [Clostridiales bacterium]